MNCVWKAEGPARTLYCDGRRVGTIAPCDRTDVASRDELATVDDGVFQWTRHFTPRDPPATPPRLTMDFVAHHRATYGMIPAVSYDGNRWGTGNDPKGFEHDGEPWSFAYHRVAVPGATYSEGEEWAVALFGQASRDGAGFACSMLPATRQTLHRLIWPEEERPLVYKMRDEYGPPFQARWPFPLAAPWTATAYIVVARAHPPRTAWRKLLDAAWKLNYHEARPRYDAQALWQLGVQFAKRQLWAEEGIFEGFSIGLLWDGQAWYQRRHYKYEIGWAGQNASLANALLCDYLRTRDESSLQKGIATLDAWAGHAPLPNGLIRCVFDPLVGPYTRPDLQDACNLGNAAECLFEAGDLARRCGLDKPAYRDVALRICDFAVSHQQPDGRLAKGWSSDGTCLDPNGTIGAYLVPPLVLAHQQTGQKHYLASAERAYEYYLNELLRDGYTTAGALDTHCIDKESAHPLLTAGLMLHDLTGREAYLRWAEHAAYYLASWQWHHTVPCPAGLALQAIDYDSFGGTAVSTQHHHIDPYATRIAAAWLRLAQLTGNELWAQRARAGWSNGMIGVSDGRLRLHGATLPPGGQCEGYFHTRWGAPGDVSLWLVAWPTAFRLETLRTLPDWSVLSG